MCTAIGLIVLTWDFFKTLRHHKTTCAIQSITDTITMTLPDTDDILDEDYQNIIRLLCQEQARREGVLCHHL